MANEEITPEPLFTPEELAALPTKRLVYFIQVGKKGPIKIGNSHDPIGRLKIIQSVFPWKLHLLATIPGGPELESQLHLAYADAHIRGEWFKPTPMLLDFIVRHGSPHSLESEPEKPHRLQAIKKRREEQRQHMKDEGVFTDE